MLCAAAIGVGVFGPARAEAAAPRVPTRLVWDGAVCGTKADFAARVAQRTRVVRFVDRKQRVSVRLHIKRRGEGLDARASIEVRGQAPIVRHIESPDCDDALDALALVVAIGIEARSRAVPRRRPPPRAAPPAPPPAEPPPAEPPPEPPAGPPSDEPTPEVTAGLPPGSAEPATTSVAVAEPAVEPLERAPRPELPAAPLVRAAPELDPSARDDEEPTQGAADVLDVAAGVLGSLSIGVAPEPLFGGALWIAVGWAREGMWAPELLVSAAHQRAEGVARASGQADFALSVASLSLCPLRWGSATFFLRPCAAGGIGRLAADGHDTFDARSVSRSWRALGGTLDAVAKVGIVEFRAVFAATVPLSRDSFSFDTACSIALCEADVFHQVAPVIWSGALGAGVRIW